MHELPHGLPVEHVTQQLRVGAVGRAGTAGTRDDGG
jgi:hypothetical protein